jgi:two-component system, cell cycle sensor histidine kinase and response regulator CckA
MPCEGFLDEAGVSLKLKFTLIAGLSSGVVMAAGAGYLARLLELRAELQLVVWQVFAILSFAVVGAVSLSFRILVDRPLSKLARRMEDAVDNCRPAAKGPAKHQTDEFARLAAAYEQISASLTDALSEVADRNVELSATEGSKSAIIDGSLDGIVKADERGRIVLFNPAAERTFQYKSQAAIGKSFTQLFELPGDAGTTLTSGEQLSALVGQQRELIGIRGDGSRFPVQVAWRRIAAEVPPVFAAFIRDLTETKRIDARLHLQLEVTRVLASRPAPDELIPRVLEIVCRHAGWQVAAFWRPQSATEKLRYEQLVAVPTDAGADVERHLRELAVGRGVGLAGSVWGDRRARWRPNLRSEPEIDTAAGLKSGLQAAACFAVSAGQQVLGVCQLFAREPKNADAEMLALFEGIGAQVGLFLEQENVVASLAERERQFRSFVVATSQIYWCASGQGEILETHKAWEEFTGQTAAEAVGLGWLQAVRVDDIEPVTAVIQSAVAESAQFTFQCHVRRHDGVFRLFEVRGVPIFDDDGICRQWVGTAADIQDKWQSKQALLAREAQLGALFESALDGMMIMDDDGRMLETNPAGRQVLARSRRELETMHIHQLTAPEVNAKALWRAFRRYRRLKGEFGVCRPDGSVRKLEFQAIADFQPGRHLSIFRDITDRKQLEEQLLQSQKMEAVGQLAGGVAHDFNNLLTVILGLCEIGLDSKPDDPVLPEIEKAGQRAAELTRQLLAFSRKQLLAPVNLQLNGLLANLEKMVRRLISEDIDLVTAFDPLLATVQADPGQIEQVVMNLVLNARDAMPKGGKLTVATANIHFDAHPLAKPGAYVMLAISDTGTGMDDAARSRVFEPFFTTKPQGKGTGLGLATVYGIVEQSAGFIDVASELGVGTSIKVYLPRLAIEVPPPADAKPLKKLRSGTETILLVEDEAGVRALARRALETRGYRVLEAASGVLALQASQAYDGDIHLLVTDVVMPQLGGRELADRLAVDRPAMRVLFMSGYTDDAIVRHGIKEDGVPFLQKPFTPDVLGRKVREVLSRKKPAPALVAI